MFKCFHEPQCIATLAQIRRTAQGVLADMVPDEMGPQGDRQLQAANLHERTFKLARASA
jgi:hypothetical protein